MIGEDRKRHGHQNQRRELERRVEGGAEPTALLALDRTIVRFRVYRGRTVVALAVWNALAALQRRGVAELRIVAHRGVDIDHARFADKGVRSDLDGADVDEIRLCAVAENDRILAQ